MPPPPANGNGHDELRLQQARVLRVLMPDDPTWPVIEWPVVTRAQLCVRAGYSTAYGCSSSINRALHGIPAGSSSGPPHPGLLARGLVEEVVLYIEGRAEDNYRATAAGVRAYQAHVATSGGKLPEVKDAALCVNNRYRDPNEATPPPTNGTLVNGRSHGNWPPMFRPYNPLAEGGRDHA